MGEKWGRRPRGRPANSQIRQNITDILYVMGKGHGYQIYKVYSAVFPRCTIESVYYHLKKGVQLGEFAVDSITREQGSYSWGPTAEKVTYRLGPNARPRPRKRVARAWELAKASAKRPEQEKPGARGRRDLDKRDL